MTAAPPECAVCHTPINVHGPGVVFQVTGWEQPRSQGGANKIVGRNRTGYAAHAACVKEPGQTRLGLEQ